MPMGPWATGNPAKWKASGKVETLTECGQRYGTDKVTHGFCGFYDPYFADRRESVQKVLEIGIARGSSLQMWRDYFPNAEIHGLDRFAPNLPSMPRVQMHIGDQASRQALNRLIQTIGSDFDVIIDDGGHTMAQQQVSLALLFWHLRPGGLYLLEDLQTSFFPYIAIRRNGAITSQYSTGINECHCTSYQLVEMLVQKQPFYSDYMSPAEIDYLSRHIESAELFDRDGDHEHVTSVIRKKA